jgi:hypothetical protein
LELKQISIRELVAVASGSRTFCANMMAGARPPGLHAATLRVGLFWLANEADTFILHNRWVGGDVWSEELDDYTTPVWETVVLHAGTDAFNRFLLGPDAGRLAWPRGLLIWSPAAAEPLIHDGVPIALGVGGALVYTTSLDAALYDFLVELHLASPAGDWRLMRSAQAPSGFSLRRGEATYQESD